ncbi:MAG: SH3 domain-containing protein [Chloroflexota bacterium]
MSNRFISILTAVLIFTAACNTQTETQPALAIPTAASLEQVAEPTVIIDPTAVPEQLVTATETPVPQTEPTSPPVVESTAVPPTEPAPSLSTGSGYRVTFVEENDVLNVRAGAGVSFDIVGSFAPNATNIDITGEGVQVGSSLWVPVSDGQVSGWVNSRFLTTAVSDDFCSSPQLAALLGEFEQAVATKDNVRLAQLIHPERGVRVHTAWWNPVVRYEGTAINNLFSSNSAADWGTTIGEGAPIIGSFDQVIVPLLEETVLNESDIGCNEILHGGTPGLIILPDGYESQAHVSYYRAGTDEFAGLNWGTWAVGVEEWQGTLYLSFLVYYQWET